MYQHASDRLQRDAVQRLASALAPETPVQKSLDRH
jgi:hypothetical protein